DQGIVGLDGQPPVDVVLDVPVGGVRLGEQGVDAGVTGVAELQEVAGTHRLDTSLRRDTTVGAPLPEGLAWTSDADRARGGSRSDVRRIEALPALALPGGERLRHGGVVRVGEVDDQVAGVAGARAAAEDERGEPVLV